MAEIKPNSRKYKAEQATREKKNQVVKNKVRRNTVFIFFQNKFP